MSESVDPLSDPKTCARDIILFQDLGINVRIVASLENEISNK